MTRLLEPWPRAEAREGLHRIMAAVAANDKDTPAGERAAPGQDGSRCIVRVGRQRQRADEVLKGKRSLMELTGKRVS